MRFGRFVLTIAVLAAGILVGFLGWSQNSTAKTEKVETKAAHERPDPHVAGGKQVFVQYCVTCHGDAGKGDGPGGANLTIKPQNLADGRVMNPLPDHLLVRAIGEGPQSVGLSNADAAVQAHSSPTGRSTTSSRMSARSPQSAVRPQGRAAGPGEA